MVNLYISEYVRGQSRNQIKNYNELIVNVINILCLSRRKSEIPPNLLAKGYFGGNEVEILMAKIRHLSEIQQEIAFTEFDFYQRYAETFKTSELGRIKSLLPLRKMAISFNLMEERPMHKRVKRGRKSFFTPEGKVALAFLKMYTGLSAPKLMEALNGNINLARRESIQLPLTA